MLNIFWVAPDALAPNLRKTHWRKQIDQISDSIRGFRFVVPVSNRTGNNIEIEPGFINVAIRRGHAFLRKDAVHAQTGRTFHERTTERAKISMPDLTAATAQ
jgi:hypothetical protein